MTENKNIKYKLETLASHSYFLVFVKKKVKTDDNI